MPDPVPVPAGVFRLSGPPLFPVLDEHGEDVSRLLGGPAQGGPAPDQRVYVAAEQLPELRGHLLRCIPRVAGNHRVEPQLRGWLLHRVLTFEVEALFDHLHAPANVRNVIEVTRALGREGSSWAATGQAPSYQHRRLVAGDYSPATHAVNTALYATAVAAAAAEQNYERLQGIALAGIFADLAIDQPSERARIDQAAIVLRRCGVSSVGAAAGVFGRYAQWCGGGTPRASGISIAFEARCVAIAADYDLLTLGADGTPRSPYDALSEMGRREGVHDPQLLRSFIRLIAQATLHASEPSETVQRQAALVPPAPGEVRPDAA